jgi:hypothetical protein
VRSFTLNGKPWIKCFAVIGALLLTLGRTGFGSEPSQQGPWLVQRSDTDAGRIEYSAVTPSIEDSDFWLGVFCFGGDRLFVTLSDTARGAFSAADRQSAFRIAFDGGTSIAIEARHVNEHMVAVDPETSRNLCVSAPQFDPPSASKFDPGQTSKSSIDSSL